MRLCRGLDRRFTPPSASRRGRRERLPRACTDRQRWERSPVRRDDPADDDQAGASVPPSLRLFERLHDLSRHAGRPAPPHRSYPTHHRVAPPRMYRSVAPPVGPQPAQFVALVLQFERLLRRKALDRRSRSVPKGQFRPRTTPACAWLSTDMPRGGSAAGDIAPAAPNARPWSPWYIRAPTPRPPHSS